MPAAVRLLPHVVPLVFVSPLTEGLKLNFKSLANSFPVFFTQNEVTFDFPTKAVTDAAVVGVVHPESLQNCNVADVSSLALPLGDVEEDPPCEQDAARAKPADMSAINFKNVDFIFILS